MEVMMEKQNREAAQNRANVLPGGKVTRETYDVQTPTPGVYVQPGVQRVAANGFDRVIGREYGNGAVRYKIHLDYSFTLQQQVHTSSPIKTRNNMKYISFLTRLCLFASNAIFAQSQGNAHVVVTPNDGAISCNISSMGSFSSVNAINLATPNSLICTGGTTGVISASGANAYFWSPSGQTHEYYNPYTGKYESAPSSGNEQASAALPYDNSVIFDTDVMINVKASAIPRFSA
jgi:hypothetical protein